MPPFIPLPDGAQAEVLYVLGGRVVENRLWFLTRQPPITTVQLQALADGLSSFWAFRIMPKLSADITMAAVVATDWGASGNVGLVGSTINIVGGTSSPTQSANVAFRVRFRSALGPTIINSNFLPGIPDSAVVTNTVDPTWAMDVFNAYVDLIDAAALFGPFPAWEWVCTSRQLDLAWRSVQLAQRLDFIELPSPYVAPRRRRLM